jgi:predicted HicB family RNase H-like nuclease
MMQHKGYVGKVEFDADAKILHGEVIGIRDVITFQADSGAEIEKAFRDSVDDYLAFCQERGEKPEKPMSGQFVVRVQPSLHRKLNMIAEAQDKSLNALVAEYLDVETEKTLGTVQKKPALSSKSRPGQKRQAISHFNQRRGKALKKSA